MLPSLNRTAAAMAAVVVHERLRGPEQPKAQHCCASSLRAKRARLSVCALLYSRWNPYSLYSIYDHLSGGMQSCSLAQLWRDQGKIAEARDLVAPVYNWFTERLDTPVLEEARKLLQSIP